MSERKTKVVAGIQARSGSTRLPRKVLADLAGRTLIERVVERARLARSIDSVVVLTTTEAGDDELAALCESRGIPVRRGSESDVLSRFLTLVEIEQPEYVVRITGDCPLIEPAFIDAQVAVLRAHGADFTFLAPGGVEGTLCGMGVMSATALRAADQSRDRRDREHVGTFFFQGHRECFRWEPIEVDSVYRREGLRLTVDEPEDLDLMRRIYSHFVPFGKKADFATQDVIRWLDNHPEVAVLNQAIEESPDNQELRRLRLLQAKGLGEASK